VIHEVVIGLGSNINPETHLEEAIKELAQRFHISRKSKWSRTKPVGITNQPDFLNGALLLETDLEQKTLKHELQDIENKMGRDRSLPKNGPRVIDLDIVIWNKKVVDKDYYKRDFIRKGVAEILPEMGSE
jgi:2-amino-4-hydroxy-6-hydroxymethyldihydropteridine diphosphokinase